MGFSNDPSTSGITVRTTNDFPKMQVKILLDFDKIPHLKKVNKCVPSETLNCSIEFKDHGFHNNTTRFYFFLQVHYYSCRYNEVF